MSQSRRNNGYCAPLRGHSSAILQARTIQDMYDAFNGDRYYKVNVDSWSRHNTIEFRQHQGSVSYEKITMWAKFCLKLVAWSADNRLTEDVRSIKDIPFLTKAEKDWFTNRANTLAGAAE